MWTASLRMEARILAAAERKTSKIMQRLFYIKETVKHKIKTCLLSHHDDLFYFKVLLLNRIFFQVNAKTIGRLFTWLPCNPIDDIPNPSIITYIFTNGCVSKINFYWYLVFVCFGQAAIYPSLVNTAVFGCWLLCVSKLNTQHISVRLWGTLLFSVKKINLLLKIRELNFSCSTLFCILKHYQIYLNYS